MGCRTVYASRLHIHSMLNQQKISMFQKTLISQARETCGTLSQSFFSHAACVGLVTKKMFQRIPRWHWYSSVRLSQSHCLPTTLCRQTRRCQCCIKGQRKSYLLCTYALSKMCWDGCHSFHATWKEIHIQQFLIAWGEWIWEEQQQIQEKIMGQGAGCLRSTCGCGSMGAHCHDKKQWRKQRKRDEVGCWSQGRREQRLQSGAGRQATAVEHSENWRCWKHMISHVISPAISPCIHVISHVIWTCDIDGDIACDITYDIMSYMDRHLTHFAKNWTWNSMWYHMVISYIHGMRYHINVHVIPYVISHT